MAYLGFSPPEPFVFQRPDDWMKWKRSFECFRLASGLAKEDEARQVSVLLYCMGDQADSVLMSTKIATEDSLKYNSVMSKFNEYFKVRRNVILEKARFNQRNQLAGESVEQYITVSYTLVETCKYGNLTEELLRDRLLVGICDSSLSERLQMDPELTLEKAKRIARQREAIKDHHQQLSGVMGDQITIDYVKKAGETTPRHSGSGSNEKPCK